MRPTLSMEFCSPGMRKNRERLDYNTELRPLSISAPPITSELATVRPRISEFAASRMSHPWYGVSISFHIPGTTVPIVAGSRVLKTSQKSGSKKVQCGCPPVAS